MPGRDDGLRAGNAVAALVVAVFVAGLAGVGAAAEGRSAAAGEGVPDGWTAERFVTGGGTNEFDLSGRDMEIVMVRVQAVQATIQATFAHEIHVEGPSTHAVGASVSTVYKLRPDGMLARDNGMIIYESGRGMVGAQVGPVDSGNIHFLPDSPGSLDLTITRTIERDDPGRLWQIFSTYPEATWNHRLIIEGNAVVTILHPPPDALMIIGRESFEPPPLTWGNGAWLFPSDAEAQVSIEAPVLGNLYLDEWFLTTGSLLSPAGDLWLPDDVIGSPGLVETGTWRFMVQAGHYPIHPAHLVGLQTPEILWS